MRRCREPLDRRQPRRIERRGIDQDAGVPSVSFAHIDRRLVLLAIAPSEEVAIASHLRRRHGADFHERTQTRFELAAARQVVEHGARVTVLGVGPGGHLVGDLSLCVRDRSCRLRAIDRRRQSRRHSSSRRPSPLGWAAVGADSQKKHSRPTAADVPDLQRPVGRAQGAAGAAWLGLGTGDSARPVAGVPAAGAGAAAGFTYNARRGNANRPDTSSTMLTWQV